MTWETIPLRGSGVTVSWKLPGGKGASRQLRVQIGSGVARAMGLSRGDKVVAQRDRIAGKLRLLVAKPKDHGARAVHWRQSAKAEMCHVFVPLLDVEQDDKPAQTVSYEVASGELIVKLPHWAVDRIVQVSRPAIPLRQDKVA